MPTIAFVVLDGFHAMALAAQPVFLFANRRIGQTFYETHTLSESGTPVLPTGGPAVITEPFDDRSFDTVVFAGGDPDDTSVSPTLLAFARHSAATARRIASICTGAFVLGEAGLLDGRRATTHWIYARALSARFPNVRVEEDRIYVVDGPVWTSAGMTAGIDLALALVEADLGPDLARSVAQTLVVSHRRAGGQSQHSALLDMDAKSDRIQSVLTYARQHLAQPLSVEELAEVARLSPRQFSRAFRAETGQSPAKAVERLRLEAARLMLERSRHTVEQIAQQTGFADSRRMREAFTRSFGQPPQAIRRNGRLLPA
jgi:transcriptional regulator GlxA family with amidase domain